MLIIAVTRWASRERRRASAVKSGKYMPMLAKAMEPGRETRAGRTWQEFWGIKRWSVCTWICSRGDLAPQTMVPSRKKVVARLISTKLLQCPWRAERPL